MTRARVLVVGALVVSLALVGVYLAAGGTSYTPEKSRNPCEPRPWHETGGGLEGLAEEFTLSALDGAACQLGVTREQLARALATKENRERFSKRFHIDDERLAKAIRAGLLRAIDDAEEHGRLNAIIAAPLRVTVEHVPLEQGIELVQDAKKFLSGESFLSGIGNALEELLP
ncbi:MAG TPA: hypothetical protein VMF55_10080 [Solirubrobacterales bacterium]|nr:hypothetical protein [Solirubrobacterales bacterium]